MLAALALGACGGEPPAGERLRVWHTFGPEETAALNQALAGRPVQATVLSFGRAQNRIADVLARGTGCPDLVRVDATWLPGLAQAGLLAPAPDGALEPFV